MFSMMTIFNDGLAILEHRCSNGEVVSLENNQCQDFSNEIGKELIKEYTYLSCIAEFGSDKEEGGTVMKPKVQVETLGQEQEEPKDFLSQIQSEVPVVCSVCGDKFKNNAGMRSHMRNKHEA